MKGTRGTRRGANPPHSTVHTQATTLASPVNVATFNTNNNLFSDKKPFRACSSGRSTEPCLNLIHEHFVSSDADFMCLQEVGTWSDVTPPIVAKRFERDASVYTCGQRVTEDPGSSGVMIIVRHGWVVEKLDRHPSGRLMIVSATQGVCRVTVACAYMPSGLDNAPRVPRDGWGRASEVLYNKRLLAQEIYDYAWRALQRVGFYVLAGDLNETRGAGDRIRVRLPGDDRPPASSPDKHGDDTSLINRFLADGSSTDIQRHVCAAAPAFTRTSSIRVVSLAKVGLTTSLHRPGLVISGRALGRSTLRNLLRSRTTPSSVPPSHRPVWAPECEPGGTSGPHPTQRWLT